MGSQNLQSNNMGSGLGLCMQTKPSLDDEEIFDT